MSGIIHNYGCVSSLLHSLDFAQSMSLLGAWVDDHVLHCLRDAGFNGLRPGHGFFVQRLLSGPATATEMAQDLGISQQAASKAVGELVQLGYVSLTIDEADRRRRTATLTERGQQAVALSRTARRELDGRLRRSVGEPSFTDALHVVHRLMAELGLDAAVEARKVRPPAEVS
jgi:DNA-binding MarR family transcriptional regulator